MSLLNYAFGGDVFVFRPTNVREVEGMDMRVMASARGGFGPEHAPHCDLLHLADADLVFVEYALWDYWPLMRLMKALMGLPQRPLVVVSEYCTIAQCEQSWLGGQFNISTSVSLHRDKHKGDVVRLGNFAAAQLSNLHDQSRVYRELNVSRVNMCGVMHLLLAGRCDGPRGSVKSMEAVGKRFFPQASNGLGDPLHPTIEHSDLLGCLAGKLLTESTGWDADEPSVKARDETAPPPSEESGWGYALTDASTFGHYITSAPSEWAVRGGGRGGVKRWLAPLAAGATLELSVPATAPRLLVEHYVHESETMGRVRLTVHVTTPSAAAAARRSGKKGPPQQATLWATTTLVGRCTGSEEFPCPPGQGVYIATTVATGLPIGRNVSLWLRGTAEATRAGAYNFSIVSVISARD